MRYGRLRAGTRTTGPKGVMPLLLEVMLSFAAAWGESENVVDGERLLHLDRGAARGG